MPGKVPAEFEITRANTGTVFTLAFTARLFGPCYRCLGDAVLELLIRAREYQDESSEDEEMRTEYVDGTMLDVSSWARDAIALALPEKILCMPDCAGLCGVCGKNLNEEPHKHSEEHAIRAGPPSKHCATRPDPAGAACSSGDTSRDCPWSWLDRTRLGIVPRANLVRLTSRAPAPARGTRPRPGRDEPRARRRRRRAVRRARRRARDRSTGPDWGAYTVDEAAQRHGAGVEQETTEPSEAYARFAKGGLARYREGALP